MYLVAGLQCAVARKRLTERVGHGVRINWAGDIGAGLEKPDVLGDGHVVDQDGSC